MVAYRLPMMLKTIFLQRLLFTAGLAFLVNFPANGEEVLRDATGRAVEVNPKGAVSLVIYTNADLEEETRALNRQLDPLKGSENFRIIRVVDLRGEVPAAARRVVEKQIQKEDEAEAKRAEKFYKKKNNHRNPRSDMATVPDYSGGALRKLNWNKWSDDIQIVVYNRSGKEVKRQTAPSASSLVSYIKGLL